MGKRSKVIYNKPPEMLQLSSYPLHYML